MEKVFIGFILIVCFSVGYAQVYPDNEAGEYEDMLTPEYYNNMDSSTFRHEVNKFIHFARQTPFRSPFEESTSYSLERGFGDGIGFNNTSQHHNAFDMHVGDKDSNVVMLASMAGTVSTYRDASKYRDYITITNSVKDSLGNSIGKMVVLYGHLDLKLDSIDNLNLNGQFVQKGDTISTHLYSGTLGGAHLHFEIRYYRLNDNGVDDFYNWQNNSPTTVQSSGPWSYGYWNPDMGYGFAHPDNHLNFNCTLAIELENSQKEMSVFPNPVQDNCTIILPAIRINAVEIYNLNGQLIKTLPVANNTKISHNMSTYKRGVYILKIGEERIKLVKN